MSSVRMSSALKRMVALRDANPLFEPPRGRMIRVWEPSLLEARSRGTEDGWLATATAASLGCNSPSSVGHLYQFYTGRQGEDTLERRTRTAAIMRESALKGSVFVGVAMTINALAGLMEVVEGEIKDNLRKTPMRKPETAVERGSELWESIYTPFATKLQEKLGSYHPDFPPFIIQAYGSVLAPLDDNPLGNLNRVYTSLVGIAALRAMGGCGPQLTSHVFGLLKASPASSADKWLSSEEGAIWTLELVDKICDATRVLPSAKL